MPHGSEEKDRFAEAIRKRNKLFEDEGQPEWGHYCELCVRMKFDSEGIPIGKNISFPHIPWLP